MIELPVITVDRTNEREPLFILHNYIRQNSKVVLTKDEAALLLVKLYDFLNGKDEFEVNNLKTSSEWQRIFPDIIVFDPDGWDRTHYDYSWNIEKISREEYERRRMKSTCCYINRPIECNNRLDNNEV